MKSVATVLLFLFLASWTLTACAAHAPAFPTLSPFALQTLVAATSRAGITPTASATQPAHPSPPTSTPVTLAPPTFPPLPSFQNLPPATHIDIPDEATTRMLQGELLPDEVLSYVLAAGQGQAMLVAARSTSNEVSLSIKTRGGTTLLNPASKQMTWQGMLPLTTEYYISLLGGNTPQTYWLTVEFPIPIKFKVDDDTAIYSGNITGGNTAVYSLFTIPGQRIHVSLNGVGKLATLALFTFGEEVPSIHASAGKTEFKIEAESLKDYVIKIVPVTDETVHYTLVVTVKKP